MNRISRFIVGFGWVLFDADRLTGDVQTSFPMWVWWTMAILWAVYCVLAASKPEAA